MLGHGVATTQSVASENSREQSVFRPEIPVRRGLLTTPVQLFFSHIYSGCLDSTLGLLALDNYAVAKTYPTITACAGLPTHVSDWISALALYIGCNVMGQCSIAGKEH
ncbi:hypothetical protein RF11_09132 [Thelohanellus kitauei]|uniref:Uncharacterized protein n=1 Tax=Thelohanellus kitauei TaxID=669202 RepID=A0A0C2MQS9_THEKT|nr:hypothetical protein RF11_09132 [Thelohanellus kitauei]